MKITTALTSCMHIKCTVSDYHNHNTTIYLYIACEKIEAMTFALMQTWAGLRMNTRCHSAYKKWNLEEGQSLIELLNPLQPSGTPSVHFTHWPLWPGDRMLH